MSDNYESLCLEIWDKAGKPLALITPQHPLTNKQMKKLMQIFDGRHSSESWYKIESCE